MYALCCQRSYEDSYALVKGLTREKRGHGSTTWDRIARFSRDFITPGRVTRRDARWHAQTSLYRDRMVPNHAEREVELGFAGVIRKKTNAEKFMDLDRDSVVLCRSSFRILRSTH